MRHYVTAVSRLVLLQQDIQVGNHRWRVGEEEKGEAVEVFMQTVPYQQKLRGVNRTSDTMFAT